MDLISVHPIFNMYNHDWPIHTWPGITQPAKFIFDEDGRRGQAMDSMVCAGVVISGATVRRSIVSPLSHLHSYALVEDSIIMHEVEIARSAVVRRAIVDKSVYIGEGVEIGVDPVKDARALPRLRRRDRGDPEGHAGHGMKVALMTREYPPEVYGGAGVHVEYLARELRRSRT